jgi:hypothetical protein
MMIYTSLQRVATVNSHSTDQESIVDWTEDLTVPLCLWLPGPGAAIGGLVEHGDGLFFRLVVAVVVSFLLL